MHNIQVRDGVSTVLVELEEGELNRKEFFRIRPKIRYKALAFIGKSVDACDRGIGVIEKRGIGNDPAEGAFAGLCIGDKRFDTR